MNEGLGTYIRARRDALGKSQSEIAEATGLTKSHLSSIELGKIALPNADIRRRLAKALGVSHLDLLVAAGEITQDEITASGAEGVVERELDSILAQICAAAEAVPDWNKAANIARGLIWTMQGVRYDQTPHAPGDEAMPAPPFANSGRGRL